MKNRINIFFIIFLLFALEQCATQKKINIFLVGDSTMANYGSIHPTITEILENADWGTGVNKMIQNESGGIEDIERIFNKPVSIFARHGGSYGPQLVYALGKKGIGYATSPVFLPDYNPIWFSNNLNFSAVNIYNKFDNVYYKDELFDPVFEKMKIDFPKMVEKNQGKVISFFGAHPCKIRCEQFWDINYYKGVNTDSTEWVIPDLRPKSSMITARKNFKRLMEYLKGMKNIELVTYKDLMIRFSYQPEYVNKTELQKITKQIVTQKSIIISKYYSPAEIFYALVQAILEYKQNGKLPEKIKRVSPLGPLEMLAEVPEISQVLFEKVFGLAATADSVIKNSGHLPSSLVLEKRNIGLGSLLSLFSSVYLDIIYNSQKKLYTIEAFDPYPKENVDAIIANVKKLKEWPIHRPDLDMDHLVKITQLQMWTIKPANERKTR